MNEHIPPNETTAPEAPAARPRLSVADLFARISLTQLTLALLVAVFLWQWLAGQQAIADMRRELAEKIAQMDGASKAGQILMERSQDQVRELTAKVATLESHYAEAQNQRVALETLYNDLSVSRDETALAEVEQLLLIAGQQLQLSANVRAALIAMQSADARLQRMDRPAFNGLRKTIAQDMDKLRALPDADIAGVNYQLDALMAAVDENVPEPVRETDKPFLMAIEDVFSIEGRGTVATGRIERGVIRPNDEIEIVGIRPTTKTVAVSAEMFNKMLDEGRAGDNVGILLRGLKKEDVERGQVLAKPGTVTPHTEFEAEVYILTKEEGGRHTPFFKGYKPQFYFRTTDVTGEVELSEGTEMVMPGDTITFKVKLLVPIAMEAQQRFAIREGGKTVGAGVVTKIIK